MRRSTSRSVRYSRLRVPTVTFTEVGAASRSREFSMETALPPVHTVTDSSPAPPDIAGARRGRRKKVSSASRSLISLEYRYDPSADDDVLKTEED